MYILIFSSICLNFVDLKDITKDKAAGFRTMPVELGEKQARFVIGTAFLVSYLSIPWLFLDKILFIPALLLGLIQFYFIKRKSFQEELVFATYLASLVCLLGWLNFFRFLN
jgi:1,4-dihydroxy-2-naphthoate octaprenyltransferase